MTVFAPLSLGTEWSIMTCEIRTEVIGAGILVVAIEIATAAVWVENMVTFAIWQNRVIGAGIIVVTIHI